MKVQTSEPLLAVFAKIKRAETQINNLNWAIKVFFKTNPYRVRSDLSPDGAQQVWKFELTEPFPPELSVMVGEILHNLRSPLDQVLCAIATLDGRSETGVSFPFGSNVEEFEAALGKQKKLPADVPILIRAAKPYKGGNDLLWALHHLNRRDKHRVGLVPVNMPAKTTASRIVFWRGLPLVIGCKTGRHLVLGKPFTDADLVETGKPLALYDARPGYLEFGDASSPGDESLEFMTTTPGAKFEADFQPSLDITISEVGFDGKPVVTVLHEARQLVEGILLTFKKHFFST